MYMFLEQNDGKGFIRFKIYNIADKKYEYNGTYLHMPHLNRFDS